MSGEQYRAEFFELLRISQEMAEAMNALGSVYPAAEDRKREVLRKFKNFCEQKEPAHD